MSAMLDFLFWPVYRFPKTVIAVGIVMTVSSATIACLLRSGDLGKWDPIIVILLVFLSLASVGLVAFALDALDMWRGDSEN